MDGFLCLSCVGVVAVVVERGATYPTVGTGYGARKPARAQARGAARRGRLLSMNSPKIHTRPRGDGKTVRPEPGSGTCPPTRARRKNFGESVTPRGVYHSYLAVVARRSRHSEKSPTIIIHCPAGPQRCVTTTDMAKDFYFFFLTGARSSSTAVQ